MVIDEHDEQVSTGGDFGCVRGCSRVAASLFPCVQPEEVHAAPVVRLLGSQSVFEDRLSRVGCPSARLSKFGGGHSPQPGAPLHDVAKSRASLAGRAYSATVVGHNHPSAYESQEARSAAAMDSTGLESSPASPYFVRRRATTESPWKSMIYHRFPRLALLCTTDSHFVLGYRTSRGPRPDVVDFQPLLADTLQRVRLSTVIADAGYDSEANHRFGREICQVRTIIPANRGPKTKNPAQGRYRRLMQTRFDAAAYRDRCQAETVVSMIKRRQESFLRSRTYWSQCRDLRLKALTHNIMILRRIKVFYGASRTHKITRLSTSSLCQFAYPAESCRLGCRTRRSGLMRPS